MNALKTIFFAVCILVISQSYGQEVGLLAYYSFDNCDATDETGNGSNGSLVGSPACDCGVSGQALVLDGIDDHVVFNGIVNGIFSNSNFTISFYFKPFDAFNVQDILSKREDCTNDAVVFDIQYFLSINAVSTEVSIPTEIPAVLTNNLDLTCWHHYVLTRSSNRIRLYLNGNLIEERFTNGTYDLSNNATLTLANSPCLGPNLDRFRGKFDELRIYNRALSEEEVSNFYFRPDHIGTRDTIVFLGNSVQTYTTQTCATSFSWTPTLGVSDPSIPNPVITPNETTTYQLNFLDAQGCTTSDTVRITVIDPADLDCNQVFLPSAFTPNGDGLNEVYQISNPQVIQNLVSFEIFDRWGIRLFATDNGFDAWDGTYNGKPLNSGVVVYVLKFICDGEEINKTGTINILR